MKLFTATAAALLIAAPAHAQIYRGEFVNPATATVAQCNTSVYGRTATTSCKDIPYHIWRAGKQAELQAMEKNADAMKARRCLYAKAVGLADADCN
jgi:hypothetical protein